MDTKWAHSGNDISCSSNNRNPMVIGKDMNMCMRVGKAAGMFLACVCMHA